LRGANVLCYLATLYFTVLSLVENNFTANWPRDLIFYLVIARPVIVVLFVITDTCLSQSKNFTQDSDDESDIPKVDQTQEP
jgi:hypothetical protein